MDEVRDFAGISIPFTTGIAVAAITAPAAGVQFSDAAILAAICTALMLFVWKCGCTKLHSAILMFFTGIFCCRTSQICGEAVLSDLGGIDTIIQTIDSTDFRGENTGAILKAFLTGERSSLSSELKAAFRTSGASHLLALSGLHLGTIYLIVTKCLAILGNSRAGVSARSITCIVVCLWYTLATGASPSVERAFLFICLNETAKLSPGRKRSPANILLCAIMIQLVASPSQISSISFQLSYLAIAGIILLFPKLDAIYPASGRMDPMKRIWSAAALSVSCQIFTAPLSWYYFRTFPYHFLLTNLLSLPLTEMLMTTGMVAIALDGLFGHCPLFLLKTVDFLAEMLIFCLETISSM